MNHFLLRWLTTTLSVLVASAVIPGIHRGDFAPFLGACLLLGIINALVRPILLLLSAPLILLTMGLFIFVVNALILLFVSSVIPSFHVDGFWSAFFGSIVISIVSWSLSAVFRTHDGRLHVITHHGQIQAHRDQMKQANARVINE